TVRYDELPINMAKMILSSCLHMVIGLGQVRPDVLWLEDQDRPFLVLRAEHFETLVFQLAHALTKSEFSAVCSYCKRPYPPKRKPSEGREHFCKDCGPAASKLLYKKRKRAEKRQGSGEGKETQSE